MTTIEDIIQFVKDYRGANAITGSAPLTADQRLKFATDLQAQISLLSRDPIGKSADATAIAYSGWLGDEPAYEVAKAMSLSSEGAKYYISDTLPGQLIVDQRFQIAVNATMGDTVAAERLLFGKLNGVRINESAGIGDLRSIDDFVSKRFSEYAKGAVDFIAGDKVDPYSVFARSELEGFARNADVPTVAGISHEVLQAELASRPIGAALDNMRVEVLYAGPARRR